MDCCLVEVLAGISALALVHLADSFLPGEGFVIHTGTEEVEV